MEEENIYTVDEKDTDRKSGTERRRTKHRAKLDNMTEEELLEHRKKVRRRQKMNEKRRKVVESVEEVSTVEEVSAVEDVPTVEEVSAVKEVPTVEELYVAEELYTAKEVPTVEDIATSVLSEPIEQQFTQENVTDEIIYEDMLEDLVNRVMDGENETDDVVHLDEIERNELKEFASVMVSVMHRGFSNPIAALKHAEESKYRTEFLFGGLFFILLFITTSVHLPILNSMFGVLDRMKIATIIVALIFMIILSFVGSIFAFVRKKEDVKLKTVCNLISLSLIPGIFTIILVFLLGYLSPIGVVLVIFINCIYWLLLCSQICTFYAKDDVFSANITMVIASVIMFLILYFAVKLTALQLLNTIIYTSSEAIQTSDGSIIGSLEIIVENIIVFLRSVDTLLGN